MREDSIPIIAPSPDDKNVDPNDLLLPYSDLGQQFQKPTEPESQILHFDATRPPVEVPQIEEPIVEAAPVVPQNIVPENPVNKMSPEQPEVPKMPVVPAPQ